MEAAEKKQGLSDRAKKLLIWCLPTLLLLFAAAFVFRLMLNRETVITYCFIILIGLVITRLILLFRSDRTEAAKTAREIVWIVVLLTLLFCVLWLPTAFHRCIRVQPQNRFEDSTSRLLDEYELPRLDIGSPAEVEYHTYDYNVAIFLSRTYAMLCRYDESDYEAEKAAVEARYSFRTRPMDTGCEDPAEVEPYLETDGCSFRFVIPGDGSEDSSDLGYFERCLIVATNDAERMIAYMVYDDVDLDEADDLEEFIMDTCGWKYIG